MRIASVVLDIPTQSLDREYSYRIPDGLDNCAVGCAVLVPFGRRACVGFVMDIAEDDACDKSITLKDIQQVLSHSYFNDLGARCARFLAQRYIAPLSSCVRLFTPPGGVPRMVRVDRTWEVVQPATHEVDDRWVSRLPEADEFTPRKTAVKQKAVLEALKAGDLRVADLTAEYGSVNAVLTALEKKGVIRVERRRRMRQDTVHSDVFKPTGTRHALTDDQARALETINHAYQQQSGKTVLLDGVTGSGKTEVYLCAIETVLQQGRSAIVLVPEISLTPQTVARFRGRFGDTVAVLHSRMSNGERFDQWDMIRSGEARVVVGARSALFAPLANIGMIIIDEEHESSYKQDQAPRYVSRDVAQWMVEQQNATLVLGSATPSIEALYQARYNPNWSLAVMNSRANGKPLPPITVVDMGKEFGSGNRRMFSRALQTALFQALQRKEKAVLLLNQRGFAQFLLCRECGYVPMCTSCSTSLTYHEKGAKLVCHHCGYERPVPAVCPECGSPYLRRFGAGTQRVESELRNLLEGHDCEIVRMDADTTSHKGDHQRLLERFAQADAAVLLGTQMIAKGLDFDDVTLVGVINADTMLCLPDFRSSERTFDLIEQVAGRCGRAHLAGHVIVQTYKATDTSIRAAAHYDRDTFLSYELDLRKDLNYPPYVRLANILLWGRSEDSVVQASHALYREIKACLGEAHKQSWQLFAPTPCVLSRLRGVWRYHILLKAPLDDGSIDEVLAPYFRKRKTIEDVNVAIDIDPISLL